MANSTLRGDSWVSVQSILDPPFPEESIRQVSMSPEEIVVRINSDAKNKYLFESRVPPIVWLRDKQGFRIQDMSTKQYNDVENLIAKYMPTDPLLKNIKDSNAVEMYLSRLMSWYPQTQSLVALKEGSKEVIGVLIGRLVVESGWFDELSKIEFVKKKDKYAYLKQGLPKTAKELSKTGKGRGDSRKSRASKLTRRSSKRQSKAGGSRKSMGAKSGSRKSMGAKGGSRKSMGAKGGSRKSMGAKGGQRKSMGAKGGQRKSMGAKGGQRKSMGAKGGQRKSLGSKSGKRRGSGKGNVVDKKKGDLKVSRPIDIIPEELIPTLQPVVFDDDGVIFPNVDLQYLQIFKKKLSDRFRIWKLLKQKMFYRVYLVAVSPEYDRFDVDKALFDSLAQMCSAFNVEAIAGVITKYSTQNAFYHIGGVIVFEVLYKYYHRFLPSDPRSYDKSIAVMFLELPPPTAPNQTREASPVKSSAPKKSRDK